MTTNKAKKGFTLTEVVISMGIVTILLTSFLGVFGPATKSIRKAITTQEADRIISALEDNIKYGDSTANSATNTPYDQIIASLTAQQTNSSKPAKDKKYVSGGFLIYSYRADPRDGTSPVTGSDLEPGENYTTIFKVSTVGDYNQVADEIEAIEGRLFYAEGQQFTENDEGELVLNTGGFEAPGQNVAGVTTQFSFYEIPTVDKDFLGSLAGKDLPGSPLFKRNIGINR